jgi:hypothetical protein
MRLTHFCASTRGGNNAGGGTLLNGVRIPGDARLNSGGKPVARQVYLEMTGYKKPLKLNRCVC